MIVIFNDYVPIASNQAAPHFIEHPLPTHQASASDSETIYLVDGIDKVRTREGEREREGEEEMTLASVLSPTQLFLCFFQPLALSGFLSV